PNFLASGGLPGGNGVKTYATAAAARAATTQYIMTDVKYPYSIQWNFGIQEQFAGAYTFEIRYLGTRGIHLPVQDRFNVQARVTPTQSLPTYLTAPTQAQLDALPLTLAQLNALPRIIPAWSSAGFTRNLLEFMPIGSSKYHGLATQITRRFSNGLQFQGAFTWSHNTDNSTADVFSTVLTPRRPQDFQNVPGDYGTSALDRRYRFTLAAIYDVPWFKTSNWFMKNVVGNFEFAPVYQFEAPEFADVQSGVDSNLNGDAAADRAIFNANGTAGVGSDVTALKNSGGATVAYLADNPNAQYIVAGPG